MVMGRKTYLTIGRALPGRETIVVTRDPGFAAPDVLVAHDLQAALTLAAERARAMGASEIIVAGGGEIYAQTIERAERLFITEVALDAEGETRFPPIDPRQWREVSRERGSAARGMKRISRSSSTSGEDRPHPGEWASCGASSPCLPDDFDTMDQEEIEKLVLRRRMKLRLDDKRPEQFGSPESLKARPQGGRRDRRRPIVNGDAEMPNAIFSIGLMTALTLPLLARFPPRPPHLQERLHPEAVGLVPASRRAHGEREQAEGEGGSAIYAPAPSRPFLIRGRRTYSAACRSRSAAASGVRSRWGEPSISKPTMNFLTVAERRSGG